MQAACPKHVGHSCRTHCRSRAPAKVWSRAGEQQGPGTAAVLEQPRSHRLCAAGSQDWQDVGPAAGFDGVGASAYTVRYGGSDVSVSTVAPAASLQQTGSSNSALQSRLRSNSEASCSGSSLNGNSALSAGPLKASRAARPHSSSGANGTPNVSNGATAPKALSCGSGSSSSVLSTHRGSTLLTEYYDMGGLIALDPQEELAIALAAQQAGCCEATVSPPGTQSGCDDDQVIMAVNAQARVDGTAVVETAAMQARQEVQQQQTPSRPSEQAMSTEAAPTRNTQPVNRQPRAPRAPAAPTTPTAASAKAPSRSKQKAAQKAAHHHSQLDFAAVLGELEGLLKPRARRQPSAPAAAGSAPPGAGSANPPSPSKSSHASKASSRRGRKATAAAQPTGQQGRPSTSQQQQQAATKSQQRGTSRGTGHHSRAAAGAATGQQQQAATKTQARDLQRQLLRSIWSADSVQALDGVFQSWDTHMEVQHVVAMMTKLALLQRRQLGLGQSDQADQSQPSMSDQRPQESDQQDASLSQQDEGCEEPAEPSSRVHESQADAQQQARLAAAAAAITYQSMGLWVALADKAVFMAPAATVQQAADALSALCSLQDILHEHAWAQQAMRQMGERAPAAAVAAGGEGVHADSITSSSSLQETAAAAGPPPVSLPGVPKRLQKKGRAQLVTSLLIAVQPHLPAASPHQLSAMLLSLSALDVSVPPTWLDAYFSAARPLLPQYTTPQLLRTLQSLGHMRVSPPTAWLSDMYAAVQPRLATASVPALCILVHAAARMQVKPGPAWLAELVHVCEERLQEFDAPAYALVLHALGVMGHRPPRSWVEEFWDGCASLLNDFTLQELTLVLRGAAYLGAIPTRDWCSALWRESGGLLRQGSAEQLAILGWSVVVGLQLRVPRSWGSAWLAALRRATGARSPRTHRARNVRSGGGSSSSGGRSGRALMQHHARMAVEALGAMGVEGPQLKEWCRRLGLRQPHNHMHSDGGPTEEDAQPSQSLGDAGEVQTVSRQLPQQGLQQPERQAARMGPDADRPQMYPSSRPVAPGTAQPLGRYAAAGLGPSTAGPSYHPSSTSSRVPSYSLQSSRYSGRGSTSDGDERDARGHRGQREPNGPWRSSGSSRSDTSRQQYGSGTAQAWGGRESWSDGGSGRGSTAAGPTGSGSGAASSLPLPTLPVVPLFSRPGGGTAPRVQAAPHAHGALHAAASGSDGGFSSSGRDTANGGANGADSFSSRGGPSREGNGSTGQAATAASEGASQQEGGNGSQPSQLSQPRPAVRVAARSRRHTLWPSEEDEGPAVDRSYSDDETLRSDYGASSW